MTTPSFDVLQPADLVRAAGKLTEFVFLQEYGHTPWLAIRLPAGREGMVEALRAGSGTDRAMERPPQQFEFRTQMASRENLEAMAPSRPDANVGDLAKILDGRTYFSAVEKRLDAEGALGARVSIGRAMNKDIVLRHASISKFHAYFEAGESGDWSITDAGSKNGTSVNGKRLVPREPRRVTNGDRVTFGSIEAVFLDARTVWRVLRAM